MPSEAVKEEVIHLTPQSAPKDLQAETWERVMNPPKAEDSITAEAVAGKEEAKPEAAPEKSDRDLVAPRLRELLAAQAPAEEKTDEPAEELTPDQLILKKLEALEQKELRAEAERAEAERDARLVALRDQMLANVEAEKESLPGFYGLEQQELLVQLVAQASEAGEEVSEIEIAREIEKKAKETYHRLHAIYSTTESKEEPAPAKLPEPTISNQLVSAATPLDLEGLSPKEREAAVWDAIMNRG